MSDSPLAALTPREREVLAEIAQGKSNAAIAESLVLTKRAVEKHINSIFFKLDLARPRTCTSASRRRCSSSPPRRPRTERRGCAHPRAGHRRASLPPGRPPATVALMPGIGVLTVDDQPLFRSAAAAVVDATPGFEAVGEASSGEEALRLSSELRPDLVLLDVRMPGIDGIETARRLAATRPETVTGPAGRAAGHWHPR